MGGGAAGAAGQPGCVVSPAGAGVPREAPAGAAGDPRAELAAAQARYAAAVAAWRADVAACWRKHGPQLTELAEAVWRARRAGSL